ncbi:unnamed protein product [marine sediment metagenome]|uniref:Uncharacterized protein n=1 Tax=marine sediment metagenome TaxID=412755 RepID=X0Y792_9ZZZZ
MDVLRRDYVKAVNKKNSLMEEFDINFKKSNGELALRELDDQ